MDTLTSVWVLVAFFSAGLLAFAPFLWLALTRRRAMYWLLVVSFLAADALEVRVESISVLMFWVTWGGGVLGTPAAFRRSRPS